MGPPPKSSSLRAKIKGPMMDAVVEAQKEGMVTSLHRSLKSTDSEETKRQAQLTDGALVQPSLCSRGCSKPRGTERAAGYHVVGILLYS